MPLDPRMMAGQQGGGSGSGLAPALQQLQRGIASQLGQNPMMDLGFLLALAREEIDDRLASEQREAKKAQNQMSGNLGTIDQLMLLGRQLGGGQPQSATLPMQGVSGAPPAPNPLMALAQRPQMGQPTPAQQVPMGMNPGAGPMAGLLGPLLQSTRGLG